MAYHIQLELPKNTGVTSPLIASVTLRPGIITNLSLRFPKGCMYLVGGRFIFQSSQIFPINQEKWFISNNETIKIEPDYVVMSTPAVLQLEGYNTDDTWQHTLYATIDMDFQDAQLVRPDELAAQFFNNAFLRVR